MKTAWSIPIASGLGLGYSPIASGTVGTVWGVVLVWLMGRLPGGTAGFPYIGLTALLVAASIPVCDAAEKHYGKKDDGRIVADEYMIFPISMIALPVQPATLVLAFLSSRVFDIIKPPPARKLQALTGGVGVVIDDVLAAFYALAFNLLAWYVVRPWLIGG